MHLGRERRCESKVSSPRTEANVSDQGSNPESLDPESSSVTMRPPLLKVFLQEKELCLPWVVKTTIH